MPLAIFLLGTGISLPLFGAGYAAARWQPIMVMATIGGLIYLITRRA